MLFYSSLAEVPADFGPSVVTFGKFDGFHRGHRHVIDSLRAVASERSLVSTVITFDRNPLSLLSPERCPESLTSNAQKAELLAEAGVDAMLQLAFDREFSALSAAEFVTEVIVGVAHAEVVLVGPDTRFGSKGLGDFSTLVDLGKVHGFVVRQLLPLSEQLAVDDDSAPNSAPNSANSTTLSGERVSSTGIRKLLAAGDLPTAARQLGRFASVRSMVVHGSHRGRAMGYPTANLDPKIEGLIPSDGVYAGFLVSKGERMPAAISIGNNPTFDGVPERQVEAHVLDRDLDLYDQIVSVEFVERVRGMTKFDSFDELVVQMGRDTERVREVLAAVAVTRS